MSKTTVVNKYSSLYDVYIGRPSRWGNPFSHQSGTSAPFTVETRDDAVDKYREYILNKPKLLAALPELKGKILGCWCAPARCHGDILAEMADAL